MTWTCVLSPKGAGWQFVLTGRQKDALNAVKTAPAVEAQGRLSPDPSDRRNPLGADRRQGLFFLSWTLSQPSCLCAQAACFPGAGGGAEERVVSYLTGLLLGLGIRALGNSLSCLLPYFEALHYPKSAKTCKVPAGLECCITNNAQQYFHWRDIRFSVTM